MKNYVQMFMVSSVDTTGPVVIQTGFLFSLGEAQSYIAANPVSAPEEWRGPKMYYFLLNKWNLAVLISGYSWTTDPNTGFLVPITSGALIYTDDPLQKQDWSFENEQFEFDDQDPASLKANQIAAERED